MSGTIALRVPSISAEPAHGLLARTATRLRLTPVTFAADLGIEVSALARGDGLDRFASAVGVDAATLSRSTASRGSRPGQLTLMGETLGRGDLSISPRRRCPRCLAEDRSAARATGLPERYAAWHRPWWDASMVLSCPTHRSLLSDACDACGERVDWRSPSVDVCRCGAPLWLDHGDEPLRCDGDAYLLARLEGGSREAVPLLDALTLARAAAVMGRLGECGLGFATSRPAVAATDLVGLTALGFQTARTFETAFPRILDGVVTGAGGDAVGLMASYGWTYRSWLAPPGGDHSGGILRDALLRHAAGRGIIATDELQASENAVTLGEASEILGMGHERTRRIAARAGLVPAGSRRGVNFAIDRDAARELARRLASLVDARTAAALLGIGRSQFRSLVAAGLVGPDEEAGRLGSGALYDVERLVAWVASLAVGVPALSRTPTSCLPLPTACRNFSISLVDVCQAISSGVLTPVGLRGEKGRLTSVVVSCREMKILRDPDPLTVGGVARRLVIHPEAASALVRAGLVGPVGAVTPQGLLDFTRANATPRDLAGEFGTSPRSVVARLRGAGLAPTLSPPAFRQLFYDRTIARGVLLADMPSAGRS